MNYTTKQLAFILYNNRSVEGVVSNFIKDFKFNGHVLNEIEEQLAWCSRGINEVRTVEVNTSELITTSEDIIVTRPQLESCDSALRAAHQILLGDLTEARWLIERGVDMDMVKDWNLCSLRSVAENNPGCLEALGISIHPVLSGLFDDDILGGGIIIPLYRAGRLVNCTTRRISDVGKLKYVQACPDLDVWGLDRIKGGHVWITEGLFDMMAIFKNGEQAASISGAMWSGPQLYQLLGKAESIDIFADNDKVGLRSAMILQRFFRMRGYDAKTFVSAHAKDPAEHFLQKGLGWDQVVEIEITKGMVESMDDMTFNFTKYLKNRRF